MELCKKCGKSLTSDEIALYKKLFNRGAIEYLCINCCAEYLEVPKLILMQKIEQFKEMGCTLFDENKLV